MRDGTAQASLNVSAASALPPSLNQLYRHFTMLRQKSLQPSIATHFSLAWLGVVRVTYEHMEIVIKYNVLNSIPS